MAKQLAERTEVLEELVCSIVMRIQELPRSKRVLTAMEKNMERLTQQEEKIYC